MGCWARRQHTNCGRVLSGRCAQWWRAHRQIHGQGSISGADTEVQPKNVEEAASTGFATKAPTVIISEEQHVFSSQESGEGLDMKCESESDTTSVGEVSNRSADLYSLEERNQFLDETFQNLF